MRQVGERSELIAAGGFPAISGRTALTYCSDLTGERFDLTTAALGRWVARTAAMLRDGYGCGPGHHAAVLLPAHWQTAAVLLGSWSIGMSVSVRPWSTAGLPVHGEIDWGLQTVFVSRRRLGSWLEDVPAARHRFVLDVEPRTGLPDQSAEGYLDYVTEVQRFPDSVPDLHGRWETEPATADGTSFREWMTLARDLARSMNLRAGDRLLVDADRNEQPVKWLLAPLAVGASVVLCANLDEAGVAARADREGATHVI